MQLKAAAKELRARLMVEQKRIAPAQWWIGREPICEPGVPGRPALCREALKMRLNPAFALLALGAWAGSCALAAPATAQPIGQVDPCQSSGKQAPSVGASGQDACHSSGVIQPPATGD